MSIRVMTRVWEGYPGESSHDLLALLALADWSDDEGRSFPSMATIGRKCRISERQAQRVLKRLAADGLVSILANEKGGGSGMTKRFQINLNKLDKNVTPTGDKNDLEGCQKVQKRGVESVTQYVIDTSENTHQSSVRVSAKPKKPKQPIEADFSEDFLKFWDAYPNQVGQMGAWKAWQKVKPDIVKVLEALAWQVVSDQWTKNNGLFVYKPENYLLNGHWRDERKKEPWELEWKSM